MDIALMYHIFRNQGPGPTTHELKSLYKFYDAMLHAMLPCPTVVLSAKDKFKIFQHYIEFSSDKAAVGL